MFKSLLIIQNINPVLVTEITISSVFYSMIFFLKIKFESRCIINCHKVFVHLYAYIGVLTLIHS